MLTLTGRNRRIVGPRSVVHSPFILRFAKLPRGGECGRDRLRSTLGAGVRRFLLRLKQNFTFVNHRCRVRVKDHAFGISVMFCRYVLGYCVLVSLGHTRVERGSVKRVGLCLGFFRARMYRPSSGPPVNVVLKTEGSRLLVRCTLRNVAGRLFTTGCRLCLPGHRRLRTRLSGLLRVRRLRWYSFVGFRGSGWGRGPNV